MVSVCAKLEELKGQKQSNKATHFVRVWLHNNQRSPQRDRDHTMNELTAKKLKRQAESESEEECIITFAYIICTHKCLRDCVT